ncbi:LysE family translocator [Pantoea sp. Seng]|nr:LysE family translocator [Pantoea sp. Seng]MXP52504.1 LysE family translocator [Pantoea sp. Seng]
MNLHVLAFIIAILPVALSPGASFTLAINNTLVAGTRGLAAIILGTALGIYTHALLIGLGISALLVRSPIIFNLLSVAGAAYLLWLGVQLLRRGRHISQPVASYRSARMGIKDAWLANLLNPKAVMLYLTVVSQFAGRDHALLHYLLLASIHVAIMALWLVIICFTLLTSARVISIRKLSIAINIGGGLILVFFAISNLVQLFMKLKGFSS